MFDNLRIYFSSVYEHPEYRRFSCRTAASFPSDTSSFDVTLIKLYFSVFKRTFRFA